MSVTVRVASAETPAPVPGPPAESCTVVIFGAPGDLTVNELVPALYAVQPGSVGT